MSEITTIIIIDHLLVGLHIMLGKDTGLSSVNQNAAIYFIDRHKGGAIAEKAAFVEAAEDGRTLTFGELAQQSDCLADFYEQYGVSREDRAAMILQDVIEFPVIFWGSLKAGVVPVPINTLLSADLYRTILLDARAKILFISHALLPVVEPILKDVPDVKTVFVVGGDAGDHLSFQDNFVKCAPRPAINVSKDEGAFWLYSSGSTGQPKGVRHVHGSLQATADTYGAKVLEITSDDVIFSVAKLFFAYGLGNGMTFPLSVGATAVLFAGRPTPDTVFGVLKKFSPTLFCGVPTLYVALVDAMGGKKPAGFENLRRSISAGEALPAEIGKNWKAVTGTDILDGVGSTELLHIFLSNSADDVVYGTSGAAVPGYQLRLVDENGDEVGEGEIGELVVNAPSAAESYWNQRDKSRTTFEGHWTRTGDKYEKIKGGKYVYCGRTDDMFKVSGIWVSPFEVEQALMAHPEVLEAAVVPAHDENDLEKPKAFVVLKSGSDPVGLEDRLKVHVKESVGKWKYPRWVIIVDELPKTATGKIQRYKLRG